MNQQYSNIPDGYMQDGIGRLVPISTISEIDLLRDQTVRTVIEKAKTLRSRIKDDRDAMYADIWTFVDLSADRFKVHLGGDKGNITLTSFCGRWKVIRAVDDVIAFDEGIQIAKELVERCTLKWAEGSHKHLVVLASAAFRTDKSGNVSASRIMGLRSHKIDDPDWKAAMVAIDEAIKVTGTKPYLRIYERDEQGKFQQIALNIATV